MITDLATSLDQENYVIFGNVNEAQTDLTNDVLLEPASGSPTTTLRKTSPLQQFAMTMCATFWSVFLTRTFMAVSPFQSEENPPGTTSLVQCSKMLLQITGFMKTLSPHLSRKRSSFLQDNSFIPNDHLWALYLSILLFHSSRIQCPSSLSLLIGILTFPFL